MSELFEESTPFDRMAMEYDRTFDESLIGGYIRKAVQQTLDRVFRQPELHILELGCGTGRDALHLAHRGHRVTATDASAGMVRIAQEKVRGEGMQDRVAVFPLRMEQIRPDRIEFDRITDRAGVLFGGALSNFGGINCIEDLTALSAGLAACLAPGAPVVLCIMGPIVPWEWIHYGLRGSLRKALRRLVGKGVAWRGMTIRYPSIATSRRAFEAHFTFKAVTGVGFLIPPTYMESTAIRFPGLIRMLNALERSLETIPPFPWLADHYVLELERR